MNGTFGHLFNPSYDDQNISAETANVPFLSIQEQKIQINPDNEPPKREQETVLILTREQF
jgi:hypothetical protein